MLCFSNSDILIMFKLGMMWIMYRTYWSIFCYVLQDCRGHVRSGVPGQGESHWQDSCVEKAQNGEGERRIPNHILTGDKYTFKRWFLSITNISWHCIVSKFLINDIVAYDKYTFKGDFCAYLFAIFNENFQIYEF